MKDSLKITFNNNKIILPREALVGFSFYLKGSLSYVMQSLAKSPKFKPVKLEDLYYSKNFHPSEHISIDFGKNQLDKSLDLSLLEDKSVQAKFTIGSFTLGKYLEGFRFDGLIEDMPDLQFKNISSATLTSFRMKNWGITSFLINKAEYTNVTRTILDLSRNNKVKPLPENFTLSATEIKNEEKSDQINQQVEITREPEDNELSVATDATLPEESQQSQTYWSYGYDYVIDSYNSCVSDLPACAFKVACVVGSCIILYKITIGGYRSERAIVANNHDNNHGFESLGETDSSGANSLSPSSASSSSSSGASTPTNVPTHDNAAVTVAPGSSVSDRSFFLPSHSSSISSISRSGDSTPLSASRNHYIFSPIELNTPTLPNRSPAPKTVIKELANIADVLDLPPNEQLELLDRLLNRIKFIESGKVFSGDGVVPYDKIEIDGIEITNKKEKYKLAQLITSCKKIRKQCEDDKSFLLDGVRLVEFGTGKTPEKKWDSGDESMEKSDGGDGYNSGDESQAMEEGYGGNNSGDESTPMEVENDETNSQQLKIISVPSQESNSALLDSRINNAPAQQSDSVPQNNKVNAREQRPSKIPVPNNRLSKKNTNEEKNPQALDSNVNSKQDFYLNVDHNIKAMTKLTHLKDPKRKFNDMYEGVLEVPGSVIKKSKPNNYKPTYAWDLIRDNMSTEEALNLYTAHFSRATITEASNGEITFNGIRLSKEQSDKIRNFMKSVKDLETEQSDQFSPLHNDLSPESIASFNKADDDHRSDQVTKQLYPKTPVRNENKCVKFPVSPVSEITTSTKNSKVSFQTPSGKITNTQGVVAPLAKTPISKTPNQKNKVEAAFLKIQGEIAEADIAKLRTEVENFTNSFDRTKGLAKINKNFISTKVGTLLECIFELGIKDKKYLKNFLEESGKSLPIQSEFKRYLSSGQNQPLKGMSLEKIQYIIKDYKEDTRKYTAFTAAYLKEQIAHKVLSTENIEIINRVNNALIDDCLKEFFRKFYNDETYDQDALKNSVQSLKNYLITQTQNTGNIVDQVLLHKVLNDIHHDPKVLNYVDDKENNTFGFFTIFTTNKHNEELLKKLDIDEDDLNYIMERDEYLPSNNKMITNGSPGGEESPEQSNNNNNCPAFYVRYIDTKILKGLAKVGTALYLLLQGADAKEQDSWSAVSCDLEIQSPEVYKACMRSFLEQKELEAQANKTINANTEFETKLLDNVLNPSSTIGYYEAPKESAGHVVTDNFAMCSLSKSVYFVTTLKQATSIASITFAIPGVLTSLGLVSAPIYVKTPAEVFNTRVMQHACSNKPMTSEDFLNIINQVACSSSLVISPLLKGYYGIDIHPFAIQEACTSSLNYIESSVSTLLGYIDFSLN